MGPESSICAISTIESIEVGLATSHGSQSPKYEVRFGLVLRVGLSKKPYPTLDTSLMSFFAQNNQNPTSMKINHILRVS